MKCQTHGKVPWRGTVVCEKCTTPYRLDDPTSPRYIDGRNAPCQCGAKLTPSGPEDKRDDFSARLCCQQCWDVVCKAFEGKAAQA